MFQSYLKYAMLQKANHQSLRLFSQQQRSSEGNP